MNELKNIPGDSGGKPDDPASQAAKVLRKSYELLASVKLALALLILILACCVTGVTIIRGDRAWLLIFSTLWFNSLLTLLVVNIAFCFFGRIWGRKVTLISLGMILFHLSFVAMLGGVIYNSLFYFRGVMRLTEGETLPSGDPRSYDYVEMGRFFDISKFTGETTLVKMHSAYTIGGVDKRAAYEIAVGERQNRKQGIIYITKKLTHNGFQYINDREGFSLLITLSDKRGKELYGAFVPLQSLKQPNDTYLYTSGTKDGPGSFPFPQEHLKPLYALQLAYIPSQIKERTGDAVFKVWPLDTDDGKPDTQLIAEGKVPVGKTFRVGEHYLTATEVRYWAAMSVRCEPGKPVVLTSLWVGLGGMIITFIGRMMQGRK